MFWYLLSMAVWVLLVSPHGKKKKKNETKNITAAMKWRSSEGRVANSHPRPWGLRWSHSITPFHSSEHMAVKVVRRARWAHTAGWIFHPTITCCSWRKCFINSRGDLIPLFKAIKRDRDEMNCVSCARCQRGELFPFPLLRSPPKETDTYTAAAQHAHGEMASLLTTGRKGLTAHDPAESASIMPDAH